MEIKRNGKPRTTAEKKRLAAYAVSLMKERDEEVMCIYVDIKKPDNPFTDADKRVIVSTDVCPFVGAIFQAAGYFVWYSDDYHQYTTYWVTRHDICPHPWFGKCDYSVFIGEEDKAAECFLAVTQRTSGEKTSTDHKVFSTMGKAWSWLLGQAVVLSVGNELWHEYEGKHIVEVVKDGECLFHGSVERMEIDATDAEEEIDGDSVRVGEGDARGLELRDDSTECGGISHLGETLGEFMEECGIPYGATLSKVNSALMECGIEPITEWEIRERRKA